MSAVDAQAVGPLLHRLLLQEVVEHGHAPPRAALAASLDVDAAALDAALAWLEAEHGLLTNPASGEPWIVHPFALSPTLFWVEGERRGWWAPCIWCALGVACLVGGRTRIHTKLGGEARSIVLDVDEAGVRGTPHVAHVPIPVARAWDNVHHFCGSTLVFAVPDAVDPWCARHGYARGDVVPLGRLWELARRWYGRHLEPDWRKWTVDEARSLFAELGLTGPTWDLGPARDEGAERF